MKFYTAFLIGMCLVVIVAGSAKSSRPVDKDKLKDKVDDKVNKCNPEDHNCGDKCIPSTYVCDGVFDCGNGNDEVNCPSENSKVAAPPAEEVLGFDAPTFDLEFV